MSNTKADQLLTTLVAATKDVTLFQPENAHREAKARFWSHFLSGDTPVPERIDLSLALRLGADKRVSQWWDLPGFQDWFTNNEEFRQRVEFLANLALDSLQEILQSKQVDAKSKLMAIRMSLEASSKLPNGKANKDGEMLDRKIAEMNKAQLEQFLQQNAHLLRLPTAPNKE